MLLFLEFIENNKIFPLKKFKNTPLSNDKGIIYYNTIIKTSFSIYV